jgi:hypothetical protein
MRRCYNEHLLALLFTLIMLETGLYYIRLLCCTDIPWIGAARHAAAGYTSLKLKRKFA